MFELTKSFFNTSGNSNVYLGDQKAYYTQILQPILSGKTNKFQESDAQKLGTVNTSLKKLSETIGRLPIHIYQDKEEGHFPDTGDYRYEMIHTSPDGVLTTSTVLTAWEYNRGLTGNAFGIIESAGDKPFKIHFVHPSLIESYGFADGLLFYVFLEKQPDGSVKKVNINNMDILHFKWPGPDPYWGLSPIRAQMLNMSILWNSSNTVDKYYENNAFSPLALKTTVPENKAIQQQVMNSMEDFKEIHLGPSNAGKIIRLPAFTELQQLTLNIIDEKFIASQKFTSSQIAAFYGLPAHKVGVYENKTNGNVEMDNLDFKSETISAIANIYRKEFEFKLLTGKERQSGKSIEFNLKAMIELDTKTKLEWYKGMRNEIGAMTTNDVCKLEGLPTFPEGNKHVLPLNYQFVEDASGI